MCRSGVGLVDQRTGPLTDDSQRAATIAQGAMIVAGSTRVAHFVLEPVKVAGAIVILVRSPPVLPHPDRDVADAEHADISGDAIGRPARFDGPEHSLDPCIAGDRLHEHPLVVAEAERFSDVLVVYGDQVGPLCGEQLARDRAPDADV